MRASSSSVKVISAAATFSATRPGFRDPGIGTMSSRCARIHARASCDSEIPTIVQAALGCFDVAITAWATGPERDVSGLLRRSFDVLDVR